MIKHIAPHHGGKTVFCGNLRHARKVFGEYFEFIAVAVIIQILPHAHKRGFVHSDIHAAGSETFRKRFKNVFNQRIHTLVAD